MIYTSKLPHLERNRVYPKAWVRDYFARRRGLRRLGDRRQSTRKFVAGQDSAGILIRTQVLRPRQSTFLQPIPPLSYVHDQRSSWWLRAPPIHEMKASMICSHPSLCVLRLSLGIVLRPSIDLLVPSPSAIGKV